MDVIDAVYQLLAEVGYTHPLHPPFTHLPMGMSIGALLFAIVSLRLPALARTARHCVVLALIFTPPTIVAGILDWQHYYDGVLSQLFIAKIILAGILPLLLLAAVAAGSRERDDSRLPIVLYALCFLNAVGLGYIGGQIVFG